MTMKILVKAGLTSLLLILFTYQSWRTILKYKAKKTSLQVQLSDPGTILFPSITVCRDEMFSSYRDGDLIPRLQSGQMDVTEARAWFEAETFSRSRLVKFLSARTVEGTNSFPCNTVSGLRAGEACTFPVLYPDCGLERRSSLCEREGGTPAHWYSSCILTERDALPWCYTRTHLNRSHIHLSYFSYISYLTGLISWESSDTAVQTVRSTPPGTVIERVRERDSLVPVWSLLCTTWPVTCTAFTGRRGSSSSRDLI